MFFKNTNMNITFEAFTCPDCGSTEVRRAATQVFFKGRNGVIKKEVCEACAEKYKKDPDYITCAERTLELVNGVPSDRWMPEVEFDFTEELVENEIRHYFATNKHFEGKTVIGDISCGEDSWDSVTLDLAPGNYSCVYWTNKRKYKVIYPDRVEYEDYPARMSVIGIYLNGNMPAHETMTEVATVGTDTGVLGFYKADTISKKYGIGLQDSLTFETDNNGHAVYIAVENKQIVAVELHTSADSVRN